MSRRLSIVLLAASILLAVMPSAVQPQVTAVDPQSLVGSWVGSWTETGRRALSGRYIMTIDKVEGDRVSGTAEMVGRRVQVPPFRVAGTLSGNRLTYGTRVQTELMIDGGRMTGKTSGANEDVCITLSKEK